MRCKCGFIPGLHVHVDDAIINFTPGLHTCKCSLHQVTCRPKLPYLQTRQLLLWRHAKNVIISLKECQTDNTHADAHVYNNYTCVEIIIISREIFRG